MKAKRVPVSEIPITEEAKAGLELILRAYCYTNYGPIGEAKKWLWKVLESTPTTPPAAPLNHDYDGPFGDFP